MFQVKVEWIQRERVLILVFFCRWAHEGHEEVNFVEISVKWNYISFGTLIDANTKVVPYTSPCLSYDKFYKLKLKYLLN